MVSLANRFCMCLGRPDTFVSVYTVYDQLNQPTPTLIIVGKSLALLIKLHAIESYQLEYNQGTYTSAYFWAVYSDFPYTYKNFLR